MKKLAQIVKIKPVKKLLFFYYPMMIFLIYVISFISCIFIHKYTDVSLDYLVIKNTFYKYQYSYNYLFVLILFSYTYSIRDSFCVHEYTNEKHTTIFLNHVISQQISIELQKIMFGKVKGIYSIQIFYDYRNKLYTPVYDINYSDLTEIFLFADSNNIAMCDYGGNKIENINYFIK